MNKRSSILAFASNLISLVLSVITCNMLLPAPACIWAGTKHSSIASTQIFSHGFWNIAVSPHSDQQSSSSSSAVLLVLSRGNAQNHRGAHLNGPSVLISPSNVYHWLKPLDFLLPSTPLLLAYNGFHSVWASIIISEKEASMWSPA